jgi:methylated-DNA-protein-cysteine methyltransferase-like protein
MSRKSKSGVLSEMKVDVLKIVHAIPVGRVVTYGDVAKFLTVSPRHIAFILAGLSREEARAVPWHRVVAAGGRISRDEKIGDGKQSKRLEAEGIDVKGFRIDLERCGIEVKKLPTGLKGGRIYKQAAT